ncbi:MAG: M20/M25/M40 family metallo-hydrolase [Bacilli bacterium]
MINKQRLFSYLEDLVQLNSPSLDESKVISYLSNTLTQLGYEIILDHSPLNSSNILVNLNFDSQLQPILLSAHMDCIEANPNIILKYDKHLLKTDGHSILGADDKAGIALILEILTLIKQHQITTRPIQVLFTFGEELGMLGSNSFNYKKIKAEYALVFDSSGDVANIINEAYAIEELEIKITGKKAHAGHNPQDGVSAIMIAAKAINNMNLLASVKHVKSNIGMINGGQATNVVCDEVTLKAEVRSLSTTLLQQQTNHILDCLNEACIYYGGSYSYHLNRCNNAFTIASDDPFVVAIKQAFLDNNIVATLVSSAGGSDANVYNEKGIKSLNLACGYYHNHSYKEYQDLEQLAVLTNVIYKYLQKNN